MYEALWQNTNTGAPISDPLLNIKDPTAFKPYWINYFCKSLSSPNQFCLSMRKFNDLTSQMDQQIFCLVRTIKLRQTKSLKNGTVRYGVQHNLVSLLECGPKYGNSKQPRRNINYIVIRGMYIVHSCIFLYNHNYLVNNKSTLLSNKNVSKKEKDGH